MDPKHSDIKELNITIDPDIKLDNKFKLEQHTMVYQRKYPPFYL